MADQVGVESTQETAVQVVSDDWVDAGDGWDWGKGITTIDGDTRTSAVEVTGVPSQALATTTQIYLCESREDIYDALEVETSTRASYGLASASATYDMASSVRTTGFDLYLVVSATAYYPRQTQSAQLIDAAKQVLEARDYAEFVRMYGDRFIDGMQTGAMYAGILQIHAQSEDVRTQVKAGLGIEGGSADLSAAVQASVTQTTNSYKSLMTTQITEKGFGGKPIQNSADVAGMIDTALSFNDTVTPENAWPMYAHLTDYTELDLPNATEFAEYVDLFSGPAEVLSQRASDAQMLSDRLTASGFADAHPECYAASAAAVRTLVASDLSDLPGLIASIETGTKNYSDALHDAVTKSQDPTTVPGPSAYTLPASITLPAPQPGVPYTVRSGTGLRLAPAPGDGTVTVTIDVRVGPLDARESASYGHAVLLADPDDDAVEQRWMISPQSPPTSGRASAVIAFVNGDSKLSVTTMTVPTTFEPATVVGLFTSGQPAPVWNALNENDDQHMSIRLQADWNANFMGMPFDGPVGAGTPVGVAQWGGGYPNEIWWCDPIKLDDLRAEN